MADSEKHKPNRERATKDRVGKHFITCPHCGARFAREEIDRTSGAPACPRCHLFLQDEVHLA